MMKRMLIMLTLLVLFFGALFGWKTYVNLGLGRGSPASRHTYIYASMMSKAIASRVRVMPAAAAMPTIKHKG